MSLIVAAAGADTGRGRHKQFYVVPAPGKVKIDGKLEEWDLSARIEMFVIEATRSTQNAKIAAMYDEEALYLSGDISDPTPMMNRHDPEVNPARAWDADAVQFRITLDPEVGYPVRETSFDYKGKDAKEDTRDDIVHMLLWHYTDDGSANLQMHVGMGYRQPRPDWKPKGLVPQDKFDGAYRQHEDGLGYTFEYRIPWDTLGAERPLRGGDVVAGTVNVLWSRPDGLAHIRMSGAAYDIMGEPGFPWQKTECWGKIIFSETGDVPRELVSEGVPPEKPLPLEFSYELPDDGFTTIQLFKPDGTAARILVPQQHRLGGENTERWDGLDDRGEILPAGEYEWRGIYSEEELEAEFRFSVHNSGRPPYTTEDGKGGWGGDHGTPRDAVALEDGMLLIWDSAEYGSGTIRVDLDGNKQWGTQSGGMHIATDGERYYTVGDRGFHRGLTVSMFEVANARPTRLESGVNSFSPPPGGDEESNQASGLLWHDDVLYVAYRDRDLIALFSTIDGELKDTWEVPAPQRMAMRPDGALAVVSGERVLVVKNGKPEPWLTEHLDQPQGIAIDADGTTFVANRGELQNVSVFDAEGAFVRSIGVDGGRPRVGDYEPDGMLAAGGLALDPKNRLWVAETLDGPKRISVWDAASGDYLEEYFGASGYFAYGHIDPARPDEIYAHHVLWEIDWENYTTRPKSTIWRQSGPNVMTPPGPYAYQHIPRMVTAGNGQQYMYGHTRNASILLRREDNVFKPFAAILHIKNKTGIALVDNDEETWPRGRRRSNALLWQDANDDQTVQKGELTELPREYARARFAWFEEDMTVRLSSGQIWHPVEVNQNRQPVYDLEEAEKAPASARAGYMALTEDEGVITLHHSEGPSLVKRSSEGEMLWNYPGLLPWRDTLNMPVVKSGRLWAMTGLMGVAGEFFAHQTYWGANQVFRTDGQYVGAILNDRRVKGRGPYAGQSEGQGGSFVQLNIDGEDRYFAIGGSNDSRVWEVHGLDTIQDLPGGTYVHTEEDMAKAREAQKAYAAAIAGERELTIVPGGKAALDEAAPATREIEGGRGFTARMAYDAKNLYVRFDVESEHGLVNAQPNPNILFRGGNCLDIQLAANPDAAPDREQPTPGDRRLLVTRRDGEPFAVHYRPEVAGFEGGPTVLKSPTGQESFDAIDVVEVGMDYRETDDGFTATVTVPQDLLGLKLRPGQHFKMDLGYLFGNSKGTRVNLRAYLHNDSFSAGVVDDIPHESRLEPEEWGTADVE